MNKQLNLHNWKKVKTIIQNTWCELSDKDVESIAGEVNRLAEAFERTYGTSPEEAKRQAKLFKRHYHFMWH